jgi:hypothetical protein
MPLVAVVAVVVVDAEVVPAVVLEAVVLDAVVPVVPPVSAELEPVSPSLAGSA